MANSTPKIFRVTLGGDDIERAAAFYAQLFATAGKRHPGARHYFDCGGVILALQARSRSAWQERSFYAVDPWENDLCFVAEGTLYT